MMRNLIAGLMAALVLAVMPAQARGGAGVSGTEVMAVLEAMELAPQLREDSYGDPLVAFELEGLNVYMNFYDCGDGRCGSLQLQVGLDLEHGTSLQVANVYNTRYRYGRVSLDDEMDPYLRYDFEVVDTEPSAHIRSQVERSGELLGSFTSAVGF